MLPLDQVPPEVIQEIEQHCPDADYSHYGELDELTRTRRLAHRIYRRMAEGEVETIVDSQTFKPKQVSAPEYRHVAYFILRINGRNSIREIRKMDSLEQHVFGRVY